MATKLDELTKLNYQHTDLQTKNVFVKMNLSKLESVEITNFAYSQKFDENFKIQDNLSHYLPPEIIELLESLKYTHILKGKERERAPQTLREMQQVWSTDVWSLGMIIIEIITGVPIWLPIPCKVVLPNGKSVFSQGVLKVIDSTSPEFMLLAQKKLMRNLMEILKKQDPYNLLKQTDLEDLLKKMLNADPKMRISPEEILKHPYCKAYIQGL